MTEKRFEVYKVSGNFGEWEVEDTLTDTVVMDKIMHKYLADRLCEKLNELSDENEQLKKALLFYIDVALCETSSNFNKDFDNICNNLFGCSYNEIKHLYLDIGVEDDVFELFQR